MVSERRNMRRTADAPAQVSVPVMVWLAENWKICMFADADPPAKVKLLNVFALVIVLIKEPDALLVKETL